MAYYNLQSKKRKYLIIKYKSPIQEQNKLRENIDKVNNNYIINKGENTGKNIKKTNLNHKILNGILLYHLIIINIIFQKISCEKFITITLINTKYINQIINPSSDKCLINNNYNLKCSNDGTTSIKMYFEDGGLMMNLTQLFKNAYFIEEIEFTVSNFANVNDTSEMFENCVNLKKINFGNFSTNNIINMSRMFYNCSSLESIDFNNFIYFNTFNVTDMSYMFTNCKSLSNINLFSLDTSKVTDMKNMFEFCKNLQSLEQNFSTSLVTNMDYMFSNCKSLTSINITNFDFSSIITTDSMFKESSNLESILFPSLIKTSSLTNMASMFMGCSSLKSLNLTNFDTYQVRFMNNLFQDCVSLEDLNISSFKTKSVVKMESMFQNCYKLKEIDLYHFSTTSTRQIYNMFYNCISMTSVNISNFDTFQITNFANLFYNCYSLQSLSLSNLDTNMISDMSYMFYNCSSLKTLNLTNFETDRVIYMNSMFEECSSLTEIIIKQFINTRTKDMSRLFCGCKRLDNIDLNNFNTTQVQNMNSMFSGCINLISLDLSNFNTSNVNDMNSMFYGCERIIYIKISNFETGNVKYMSSMFEGCSSLTYIEIGNFVVTNVIKMDSMFKNCKLLTHIPLSSFNTRNLISMKSMFYGCITLESLDLSAFFTNKVEYMNELFYGSSSLISLNLEKFYLNRVQGMGYMFYGCKSLISLTLPGLNNLVVSNTTHMFMGCSSITSIDLSYFDLHNSLSFDYMFADCSFLNTVNLYKWNTKNVRTMEYMFAGCSSLTSLNILSFETPYLETVKGMFYGCISLTSLDLSHFNTSSVVTTAYMFYRAYSLLSLNLIFEEYSPTINTTKIDSYFDTPSVKDMSYMFAYCSDLEGLDLSYLNTSNVEDMSYMFKECTNLTSVNLSNFNTLKVVSMKEMFYNCYNISYINLNSTDDHSVKNLDQILVGTPNFTVFCIDQAKAQNINKLITIDKGFKDCYSINCSEEAQKYRKRIDFENGSCVDNCSNGINYQKYEYKSYCYTNCPNGTHKENLMCVPTDNIRVKCSIERILLDKCKFTELDESFNSTTISRRLLIDKILEEMKDNKLGTIINNVLNGNIFNKTIFNETYQISTLSNKNKLENLSFIDVQDCENLIRRSDDKINEQYDYLLYKIEYATNEFQVPIIEYKILSKLGIDIKEADISACKNIKFYYHIPFEMNTSEEYLYNPNSDYFNEICEPYTTKEETDILLVDRRKEFNKYNMSLCESNCNYVGYENGYVICECDIKNDFNKFLSTTSEERYNLIYRFEDSDISKYNFRLLSCFKILFTEDGFYTNYSSILFLSMVVGNILLALFFCIRGYKSLYFQIKWLSDRIPVNTKPQKKTINNTKKDDPKGKNIITTGNPPKIKNDLIKDGKGLKLNKIKGKLNNSENIKDSGSKMSSLFNSRNAFNKSRMNNSNINSNINTFLNKDLKNDMDLEEYINVDPDLEMNFMPYSEAVQKDKRSFFQYYVSLLKSRHLIISIFINDYNSILIKISFVLLIFGICIGVNTIFFNDESIQRIYLKKGGYSIVENITLHLMPIMIAAIAASLVKSITAIFIYTDKIILKLKEKDEAEKDERMNATLIKVTSKSMLLFIITFIILSIFWIYVGSICAIYHNSQVYLIVNGCISFVIVLGLPFLYNFLTALLRISAVKGKNSECLYKMTQFIHDI